MATDDTLPTGRFDAVVIGGGHNGLVAAAYLGRAGRRVIVLEARDRLGGPCGTYEFLPGYRAAFTNSPGSLEPAIVAELDLPRFGLSFVRPDPTVVHPFAGGLFLGWRDRARVDAQLDAFAPGEAVRYHRLLADIETFAAELRQSMFDPSPGLAALARRLTTPAQERMFHRLFLGSLRDLLDEALVSEEAKALMGLVALNANLALPSSPGTAVGLLLRPLSMASTAAGGADDPRKVPLRGSTGLPRGGMGAIIDALAACCASHGVAMRTSVRVARVLHRGGKACGVVTEAGDEIAADVVISAIHPAIAFRDLLDDTAVPAELRRAVAGRAVEGSAFKAVLALDGLPTYAGLPADVDPAAVSGCQVRIAPSLDYIEASVADGIAGLPSARPIMWGLFPTATSPELAPPGRHILSLNIWHAPHRLREGEWIEAAKQAFGERCIAELAKVMPDLPARIVGQRFMSPVEIESELNLVSSNITHLDMLAGRLFGGRPHPEVGAYATPLAGFWLTGAGTWPGGYVTGVPGRNAAYAILATTN